MFPLQKSRLCRVTCLAVGALFFHGAPVAGQTTVASPPEFSAELARVTFDSVWNRIANTHYDPDLGGVDWGATRDRLRPKAEGADSNAALREVLRELVGSLGLSHFAIFEAESTAPAQPQGGATGDEALGGEADVGVRVRWLDGALLVTSVRTESPAAEAGIRTGWEVVEIGGWNPQTLASTWDDADGSGRTSPGSTPAAFRDYVVTATARDRLSGALDSFVELRGRGPDGVEETLKLARVASPETRIRFGNLPPIPVGFESEAIRLGDGDSAGSAGWIRFSAWFPVIAADFAQAVDTFRESEGVIIDLRGNPGGVGGMIMGIAGHFFETSVDLGEMRLRESTLRFPVNPQRVTPDGRAVTPFAGPVAILVDPLSASTSELFAQGLQAHGRARVFGETTAGQALPAVVIPLPNGDRLMHVIADFTAPGGVRLEGRGVIPDVFAPPSREALLRGEDAALAQALAWIASGGDLENAPSTHFK